MGAVMFAAMCAAVYIVGAWLRPFQPVVPRRYVFNWDVLESAPSIGRHAGMPDEEERWYHLLIDAWMKNQDNWIRFAMVEPKSVWNPRPWSEKDE